MHKLETGSYFEIYTSEANPFECSAKDELEGSLSILQLLNSCNSFFLMLRRRLTGALSCRFLLFALKQLHDDREKNWRHKNAEERHANHPAEHRGADCLAHFRAGSDRIHQREYSECKREGGHQDGSQTQSGSFNRGVLPILTRIHLLLSEFDD